VIEGESILVGATLAAAAALYAWAFVRARRMRRPFPVTALAAFAAGLAALGAALLGTADDLADRSLAWHMAQHLVLVSVAAPLLLLGAPLRLALCALPARTARRLASVLRSTPLRVLTHPAVAWLQFAIVLYGTHFSPLYEAALEHPALHAFEHMLYLGSGLIFWTPLLAVAPAPHAPSHPVRLLALFLALPMSAFLGFLFYVAGHVMYPHYATRPAALADQASAGTVMWVAGGLPLFAALLICVAAWGARERRLGAIA
jgi:cytochrome c oxidase assembly factor CtaG